MRAFGSMTDTTNDGFFRPSAINDPFSVFFKALNLTDAAVVEHGRFDNQLLNVQEIGRTFTIGVRAKL